MAYDWRIIRVAGAFLIGAWLSVAPGSARAAWGGWDNLGGVILEQPNCVSWGDNRIDCFARGTNRAMYHRWWNGSAWGGWENLGGVILEEPNCVSWSASRIDCFARGTDAAMYHRWWNGSAWGGWENLGGTILEGPECVSWSANRIDCFARGTNRAMYHRWWNGASWGGWENLGGIILEEPSCVSWGANRIDCFARGTNRAMYHRWWNGSSWGGWENLGGVLTSRPDCVSWAANRIDCFGRGLDGAMWHRWWNGSAWGGWENLGGIILEEPDCVSWGPNRIDCFARGLDEAMWHRWWNGSAWGGWENLGGVIVDKPNCVSWGTGRLDCFGRGLDSAMWHRWWPCPTCGLGQRKSVNALSAAELMSLRRGVAAMKARDTAPRGSADFRRSWLYWANMHAHFGADCGGPVSGSGMAGVQTFTATNAAETATWCQCEHGTERFLTWHRMYIWYFERVLQQAAGDPTLRLPFWDYATDPQLPAAYRAATYVDENGQTVPNPLRAEARQAGLNNGSSGLSAGVSSASGAMGAASYNAFNASLEGTPHGAVHCAVASAGCPTGLMGAVPAAALDPIFYAHHTNIDRLYDCWLRVNESARLPNSAAHLDTEFTFVDGDGSTPTRRVGDMLRSADLGYAYAGGGDCPAIPPAFTLVTSPAAAASGDADTGAVDTGAVDTGAVDTGAVEGGAVHGGMEGAAAAMPASGMTTSMAGSGMTGMTHMTGADMETSGRGGQPVASAGPTRLDRGVTKVPLEVSAQSPGMVLGGAGVGGGMGADMGADMGAKRATLVIDGLSFDEAPGALYNVYLAGQQGQTALLGVINTFTFTAPALRPGHEDHAAHAGHYEFDATEALQQLGTEAAEEPSLVFEPTTGLTDSTPEAAADRISAGANVRFESARLVITP